MWTTENRPGYNRDKLRYPSVKPLIPPASGVRWCCEKW
jgi:hypothetical protein